MSYSILYLSYYFPTIDEYIEIVCPTEFIMLYYDLGLGSAKKRPVYLATMRLKLTRIKKHN